MNFSRTAVAAEDRVARLLRMQSVLTRLSRELGPALELQPVLETILRAMRALFEFKGGTICLVEDGMIRIAATDPAVSAEVAALRLPVGSGIAGRVVALGTTIYSPDLDNDERVDPEVRRLGSNANMKSYLAVPLVCLGEVIGLIQVDSARAHAFDEDDVVIFEGFAVQAAGAIESARRYEHVIELERLKRDFLARVSHELRTPLTVINGYSQTLSQQWKRIDEATRADMLDRLQIATGRLRDLIEELLQVTSLDAGMPAVLANRVVLAELFARVARESLSDRVRVSCAPGLILTTDDDVLRHVLSLAVDNALTYAGDAELSVASESPLVIEVRDHGAGIPAQLREKVFERFVRGREDKPGMGLGLYLMRMLAGAIGARVALVDPPSGEGACVRFTFDRPAARDIQPPNSADVDIRT